jgi:hypothetical protein
MGKHVPLTSGFMLTSIVGFFASVFFVMKIDLTWGFTFALFFVITFISSVISMSKIDAEDKYGLEELAIHEQRKKKRRK